MNQSLEEKEKGGGRRGGGGKRFLFFENSCVRVRPSAWYVRYGGCCLALIQVCRERASASLPVTGDSWAKNEKDMGRNGGGLEPITKTKTKTKNSWAQKQSVFFYRTRSPGTDRTGL